MAVEPLLLILDRIRSAYNVGSMLRTADCAGIEGIVTVGYTPQPNHPRVIKTSLGAEEMVSHKHFTDLAEAVPALRAEGYQVYAAETTPEATSLWETTLPKGPTAIILGNEVEGLDPEDLKRLDIPALVIPMRGQKRSLNVANTAAVFAFEITRKWL